MTTEGNVESYSWYEQHPQQWARMFVEFWGQDIPADIVERARKGSIGENAAAMAEVERLCIEADAVLMPDKPDRCLYRRGSDGARCNRQEGHQGECEHDAQPDAFPMAGRRNCPCTVALLLPDEDGDLPFDPDLPTTAIGPTGDEVQEAAREAIAEHIESAPPLLDPTLIRTIHHGTHVEVEIGGERMTEAQFNAARFPLAEQLKQAESTLNELAPSRPMPFEPASYPLPVWGPDATAEQIAQSIPGGKQVDVARVVMGWLDSAQLADRIPDEQAVMVTNWLMADFTEASDVIGCIPRPLYLDVLTGLLERVNPEAITDHMPAEHVQDVATLLNARAREQEDVVRAHTHSKAAADDMLKVLAIKTRLTPADKNRLHQAIEQHETEERA